MFSSQDSLLDIIFTQWSFISSYHITLISASSRSTFAWSSAFKSVGARKELRRDSIGWLIGSIIHRSKWKKLKRWEIEMEWMPRTQWAPTPLKMKWGETEVGGQGSNYQSTCTGLSYIPGRCGSTTADSHWAPLSGELAVTGPLSRNLNSANNSQLAKYFR